MVEIGVVHLIRAKNGKEPFIRFLASYAKCPGGIEHDLLIIYKGFKDRRSIEPYESLLIGTPHRYMLTSDFGFDITAYFKAAVTFQYRYFCFLNSFCEVLDENWLAKLYRNLSRADVGLVGATGSYESALTNTLRYYNNIEGIFCRMTYNVWIRVLASYFEAFPNRHIRTNAFMIEKQILEKIHRKLILTKMDAHRFESGKNSLTRQVEAMNLKVLVVGKDGLGYQSTDWHLSNTFRQSNQKNLLISDNQTNQFLLAGPELKNELTQHAWGRT